MANVQSGFLRDTPPEGEGLGALVVAGTAEAMTIEPIDGLGATTVQEALEALLALIEA